ncbi:HIRAN domain-containing protein [Lysinibacillus yapensis]|nr:HIRAN domain-containing protein [Lysinibacillus yapensis]
MSIDEFERDNGESFMLLKDGTHLIKVAGISYENRQEHIEKMTGEEEIELKREKENEFDENAIAIYVTLENGKEKIGYIPADLAGKLAKIMDSGDELHIEFYCFTTQTYTHSDYKVSYRGLIVKLKEKIYEHKLFRLRELFKGNANSQ